MATIKSFNFYGYYVKASRHKNTDRITLNIFNWEYHFTVFKKVNNKFKIILTLNTYANNISYAKKELRYKMIYKILLEGKGNTYHIPKLNKKEIKFMKLLSEHYELDKHINKEDVPPSIIKRNNHYLTKRYKSGYITLYRGIGWSDNYGGYIDPSKYDKQFKKISYWTTSKQIAYNFSEHHNNTGIVIAMRINIKDILISYHTINTLKHEREVIVKSYPKTLNFKEYNHKDFKKKFNLKERWS
ncbi:hypothetical protein LCGC14_0755360 [marine sediment metagenome]|uniref:Uncharacterized protein n=1 Tax=marine sediment metagenome TaxID=412755 RepID=A0A0F9T9Q5_9ZZZZ